MPEKKQHFRLLTGSSLKVSFWECVCSLPLSGQVVSLHRPHHFSCHFWAFLFSAVAVVTTALRQDEVRQQKVFFTGILSYS